LLQKYLLIVSEMIALPPSVRDLRDCRLGLPECPGHLLFKSEKVPYAPRQRGKVQD
jgi:hypothetical protein